VDYVWHVRLRSDYFGRDVFGAEIGGDDFGGCAGVAWWIGRWCLDKCLQEGDVCIAVGVDCLEEVGGLHFRGVFDGFFESRIRYSGEENLWKTFYYVLVMYSSFESNISTEGMLDVLVDRGETNAVRST
jgi:hypothetical protein